MSVNLGLNITNRLLRTQQFGRPRMVVDPFGAKILIQAFQGGYCRDTNTDRPIKDGVYDHVMDAFRYPAAHLFDLGDGGDLKLRHAESYMSLEEKWNPVPSYGTNVFAEPAAPLNWAPSIGQTSFQNPYRRRR